MQYKISLSGRFASLISKMRTIIQIQKRFEDIQFTIYRRSFAVANFMGWIKDPKFI